MSDYDAFRKIINHEANQDDDGGFFAKLGGIDPEPDDDGPTAKGLFQHMDRDNGGKLPAGLAPIRNTTGKREHLATWDEYLEAEKQRQEGLKLAVKYIRKKYGPKRKHAITVRKLSGWYGNFWKFSCTPCGLSINHPTWATAYHQATHHAHNHH